MDIFSRVVFAPRVDLAIAIVGTLLSAMIGGVIGAIVGYYEGQRAWRRAISTLVMRSADVLQAFPVFVFAIALVAVFGQSVQEHYSRHRLREHAHLPEADANPGAVDQQVALCRGGLCGRCLGRCDPAAPCDPQCRRATVRAALGQHRLVGAVDRRTKLRRRGRGRADAGMGQHDRHGISEHRHRTMVAVCLSRYRARASPYSASRSSAPASRCWPIRYVAGCSPVR